MSVKIYKLSDRIPIKIGDVIFKLAPFSQDQRTQIHGCYTHESGSQVEHTQKAMFLSIKFAVKEVEGLEYADGSKYDLKFEKDGSLTDECVNELLNMGKSVFLGLACLEFLNGIPEKIIDRQTGKEIKGVEILPVEGVKKKK